MTFVEGGGERKIFKNNSKFYLGRNNKFWQGEEEVCALSDIETY